jgi:hypothetical protein
MRQILSWAFARRPVHGTGAVGLFPWFRLVLPVVRNLRVRASAVALAGVIRLATSSSARTLQIRSAFRSCTAPESAPDTHMTSGLDSR